MQTLNCSHSINARWLVPQHTIHVRTDKMDQHMSWGAFVEQFIRPHRDMCSGSTKLYREHQDHLELHAFIEGEYIPIEM